MVAQAGTLLRASAPVSRRLALLVPAAPAIVLALAAHAAPSPTTAPTASASASAGPSSGASVSLAFEKFALPNGLTVVLHEDHSQPRVVVDLLVRVGSRFERTGRTGFAHLFEHLMFMGTERVPTGSFDGWMEAEGGFNNAWTSEDHTNYFDVAPSHALPLLLWLEADRLSALGSSMTAAKLDTQRDVVRNERRQTSENQPYGKLDLRLPELLYPAGHPYHHPVIGSHDDLQAATVDDVRAFFADWYAPNNCVLVVAGDFTASEARKLIDGWFSSLARAAVPPAPPATEPPPLEGVIREDIEDDVELEKLVFAWRSPARYAPGDAELDLLSAILSRGKASRLHQALVSDRPLARSVTASQSSGDHGSRFVIEVLLRPGVDPAQVEAVVLRELARARTQAPTAEEVARAAVRFETAFVERLESLTDRASALALYEATKGDPGYGDRDLARYRKATADGVREAASSTLDPARFVLLRGRPRATAASPADKGAKR